MSFGYSIGDFIAGANLSYRLLKTLSSSRGASQEYQDALGEISAMHQAFLQVGRMTSNPTLNHATINAASHIVLSSMSIIDDFLAKTKEYRERLCGRASGNALSDSWQKMGWVLFRKEEQTALKDALHIKLNSISVLLATAQFHEQMPSAVAQYQVTAPGLPSISSPPPLHDSQMESQLPRSPDAANRPRSLTDTLHTEGKSGDIEARFAKLEEFMNQHHIKEPTNAREADDIQSLGGEHSDNESKGSLKDFEASSKPHLETGIFSQFEKVLKVQQQKSFQDPGLLLDIERIMRRIERGTPMPLKFKDAVGRKFTFPFETARTWPGIEDFIRQAFLHVDVLGQHVQEGHYDLIGPSGDIILPQVWESVVEPDMAITMHMWPMPEPSKPVMPMLPSPRLPLPRNFSSDDDDGQSSRSASPTLVEENKKGRHWRMFKKWSKSSPLDK